jgi:hypothetical protein
MKRIVLAVIIGVAVLLTVLGLNRRNEAQRIRGEWAKVLHLCRKETAGSLLSAATRPLELQGFFTSNALIETGAPYPLSLRRAELPPVFGRLWQMADHIQVHSRGEDIVVAESRRRAVMEVTVEVQAGVRGDVVSGLDAYRLEWSREEGPWRIQRIQRMDTIRNPAAGTY